MPVAIPAPDRPHMPQDYGVPATSDGMLTWDFVTERVNKARNFWISTIHPDNRPHTRATWGVWVDDTLYFGGSPDTRWARNLVANPEVSVQLENADEAVIIEGTVDRLTEANADAALLTRIDDAYEAKYGMRHGTPVFRVKPRTVFAWKEFPTTPTCWRFNNP